MNSFKKILLKGVAMLSLSLGFALLAQGSASAQQAPPPLPTDSALITGTLPNGLTYFIRHNEEPKDRADFYIVQRVGSMLEEDSQSGLAHFLEHMAFNGTKNFPGKKLINYLQRIGVKFGADLNAYTSFDETVYTVMDAPTNKKGVLDSCLLILHDWSNNISLEGKEIDDERGVIHEEWRTRDNGNLRNFVKIMQAGFPNNKYAKRMPIGSMDVVDNFNHKELRDYYQKWYRPDLQAIIVVGDIDAKATEEKLKEIFKDIPKPVNPAERVYTKVEMNEKPLVGVATDPEATSTSIMVTFKAEPMPREMKATQFGLVQDYLTSVLSQMINTRFQEISRKSNSPFLYAYADYDEYLGIAQTMNAFTFNAVAKDGGYQAALKALAMEIEKIKKYGFTQGEYTRASKDFMVSMKNVYDERNKRKNKAFADQYVSYFTRGGVLCDIPTQYKIYQALSSQLPLQVVNQSVKQLLTDKGVGVFLTGPKKDGITYPSDSTLLKEFTEYSELPVEPYKDKLSNVKLMDKKPTAGKIVKEEAGKFDSKVWTLSNGAKVVVKKTDFKENQVSMKAYHSLGTLSFPDKDLYNGKFFNNVVNNGGLAKFSQDDLDKILSGRIASVTPYLTAEDTRISGSTTTTDLETMMQLLYLNFTAKRSDNDAFKAAKEKYLSQLEMKKSNPLSSLGDSIQSALYPNNPYHKALTKEDFSKISYDRIMQLYKQYFSGADGFTFFFIGNFDEAKLKSYVETYIASLPKGNKINAKNVKKEYPRKGLYHNYFAKKLTNPLAIVVNIYTGLIDYSQENSIKLDILSEVMDQVYTASIREKEGGTYGVSTMGDLNRNPKNLEGFTIYFQTSPEKALFLNKMIETELKQVAKNGADKDMFNKVIENLHKDHAQNLKKNGYWMSQLQEYYIYNSDNVTNWEKIVASMTPKKIGETANNLLKQGNLTKVIIYTKGKELK